MPESKTLVLGSNSFTGSHFVDHCLSLGHSVIGISRSDEYPDVMLAYKNNKSYEERFHFFRLDIRKDLDAILRIVDKEKPNYVANFAAQGEVRNSWKYPAHWYETNTIANALLADSLISKEFIEKYYLCSTPEVYGSTGSLITENHTYQPSTPYAISKLSGDLHALATWKRHGLPVVITRAANVYGERQQLYRIIPRTVIYLKLGRKIQLHGGGLSTRSFIYIADMCSAIMKSIENGKNGEIYHISTVGEELSIARLVQLVCLKLNKNFLDATESVNENYGQDENFSLNVDKAKAELKWSPSVTLEQGIDKVIRWIEDHWAVIKELPREYVHKR